MNFIINCKKWNEKTWHLQDTHTYTKKNNNNKKKSKYAQNECLHIEIFLHSYVETVKHLLLLQAVETFWAKENDIKSLPEWLWTSVKILGTYEIFLKYMQVLLSSKAKFFSWLSTYVILYGWGFFFFSTDCKNWLKNSFPKCDAFSRLIS